MATILLAEDDENLRKIYAMRLRADGFTIIAAPNGEEALAAAKTKKPDLVLADIMMPKVSGFELLEALKKSDELKDVKVIMLTALGQPTDQERAFKLGALRYLVKSDYTLDDIVKIVHEILEAPEVPAGNIIGQ